ncbi:MAG: hypothetical protein RRZ65_06635, partial [Tannerellaceae bacterium]
ELLDQHKLCNIGFKRAPILHVSHELTERQIDRGVKRGIIILKSVLNNLTIMITKPFEHSLGKSIWG